MDAFYLKFCNGKTKHIILVQLNFNYWVSLYFHQFFIYYK